MAAGCEACSSRNTNIAGFLYVILLRITWAYSVLGRRHNKEQEMKEKIKNVKNEAGL
jgi:hypothetical protein